MQARKQTAPGRPSAKAAGSGRVNSIGLGAGDLGSLLDEIDHGALSRSSRRRNFVRWPFRHSSIPLTLVHPGGNTVILSVACRNLSCGGMSLLHNSYLYPGSRCIVTLPHPRHGQTSVPGQVVRCLHMRGTIHEVGVAFDSSISARDFVDIDPFADWFSLEQVAPQSLRGRVLTACPSPLDSKLLAHFFRTSGVTLVQTSSLDEALATADSSLGMVIADLDLRPRSAADLIIELRARSLWTPVVALLPDLSTTTRARAATAGASGFLSKPLAQDTLLRAAGEFLIVSVGPGLLVTTLPPDHPSASLAGTFVAQLPGYADRLASAIQRADAAECRSICLALQGSAPPLGFERLADIASAAAQALGPTLAQVPAALRALMNACRLPGGAGKIETSSR